MVCGFSLVPACFVVSHNPSNDRQLKSGQLCRSETRAHDLIDLK